MVFHPVPDKLRPTVMPFKHKVSHSLIFLKGAITEDVLVQGRTFMSVGVIFMNYFAFIWHLLFTDNLELITPENPKG